MYGSNNHVLSFCGGQEEERNKCLCVYSATLQHQKEQKVFYWEKKCIFNHISFSSSEQKLLILTDFFYYTTAVFEWQH